MTAQPISCDSQHGVLADMMLTNLHNGDTQSFCSACAPSALRAIADELDPPAAPVVDAAPAEAASDASEGDTRPNGRRPRSRRSEAVTAATGTDDQGSASEAVVAADDVS